MTEIKKRSGYQVWAPGSHNVSFRLEVLKKLIEENPKAFDDQAIHYLLHLGMTPTVCNHNFPNTGLQRSWCKDCGAEGTFNWQTGTYTE